MFLTILRIPVYTFDLTFHLVYFRHNELFSFFPNGPCSFLLFLMLDPLSGAFIPPPFQLTSRQFSWSSLNCSFLQEALLAFSWLVFLQSPITFWLSIVIACTWNSVWLLEQLLPSTGTCLNSARLLSLGSPSPHHVDSHHFCIGLPKAKEMGHWIS